MACVCYPYKVAGMGNRMSLARHKFRIAKGRWLTVVIWPNERETTKAWHTTDKSAEGEQVKKSEAVYGFCLYTIGSGSAQIHLSLNLIGAGLWAHELQHLILHELRFRKGWRDEPMAELAGKLTRQFWRWFYKRFTEVKPGMKA